MAYTVAQYAGAVQVGQIVGTRNTAQHQKHAEEECHQGTVDCVSRVFESSAKGHAPSLSLSLGDKKDNLGEVPGLRSRCGKPDLVARARKLGIDKIARYPHLGSCQHHVATGNLLLRNKGTAQMQMTARDRNEDEMHIIRKRSKEGMGRTPISFLTALHTRRGQMR